MKTPMSVIEFARLGGHARAKKLTKDQKSRIGRKAAKARWNNRACGGFAPKKK
jgi:hypothetical protein